MCKFLGTELKKDQYVLLTGCKVKGENALYKVIHDVANEENYSGDNGSTIFGSYDKEALEAVIGYFEKLGQLPVVNMIRTII